MKKVNGYLALAHSPAESMGQTTERKFEDGVEKKDDELIDPLRSEKNHHRRSPITVPWYNAALAALTKRKQGNPFSLRGRKLKNAQSISSSYSFSYNKTEYATSKKTNKNPICLIVIIEVGIISNVMMMAFWIFTR